MDTTKFTMGIVGLVVIILMVTGAVLPVVQSSQESLLVKEQNTDYNYVLVSDDDTTYEVLKKATEDASPTINGVEIQSIVGGTGAFDVDLIWDKGVLTTGRNAEDSWNTNLTVYFDDNGSLTGNQYVKSAVFSSGVVTLTTTSDTVLTSTYEYLLLPSENGTYASYTSSDISTKDVYADSNSTIYYYSDYWVSSMLIASGTIKDLAVSLAYSNNVDVTTSVSIAVVSEPTEYGASNKIDSIDVTGFTLRNVQVFVPIEYSAVEENSGSEYALIGIIPLLLIIVAVLYAVRLMGASRN